MMDKVCRKCKELKPIDQFSWKIRAKDQRQSYCKPCHNQYLRDNYDPNKKRRLDLLNKYNITEDHWDTLYSSQSGKCKICKQKKKLVVDHCHTTGEVRGLLCHSCNMGLGKFYDNVDFLANAIQYLKEKI